MKGTLVLCLACALLGVALALAYWPALPETMPVHWGPDGTPDGFMPRWIGVGVMPAVTLLVPALVWVVSRLDPRQAHVARNWPAVSTILVAVCALLVLVQWAALQAATSPGQLLDGHLVMVGLGLLWMVLGNVMPKLRSNRFAGIRTPWTLRSEKVWHLTHRVAGWSMALGGVCIVVLTALLPATQGAATSISLAIGSVLVPYVYSYFAWKKHHPEGTVG